MTALPPLPNPPPSPSPTPTPPPAATGDGYRLATPPAPPPGTVPPGLPPASLSWLLWLLWWLQQRERDRQKPQPQPQPQPEPTPPLAGTDATTPALAPADNSAKQLLDRAITELILAGARLPAEAVDPPAAMPSPLAGP
jgi:hypothetical protein